MTSKSFSAAITSTMRMLEVGRQEKKSLRSPYLAFGSIL